MPSERPRRAAILIADGHHKMTTALDLATAYVRRRRTLLAVRVERDTSDGDRFIHLVDQRRRGEIDLVVLPDPSHLPEWIVFARQDVAS